MHVQEHTRMGAGQGIPVDNAVTDRSAAPTTEVSEFCKLNTAYHAPTRIHSREMASARQDTADLTNMLILPDYRAHDLPSCAAVFALIGHAYGVLMDVNDLEERMAQPASMDDVAIMLNMKLFPVFPRVEYVRYYLNTRVPVAMCLTVPVDWILDDSGNARVLETDADYSVAVVLIACVAFKHALSRGYIAIAFDKENETHIRYVEDGIIEKHARDVCLIDTSTMIPPKTERKKRYRIKEQKI